MCQPRVTAVARLQGKLLAFGQVLGFIMAQQAPDHQPLASDEVGEGYVSVAIVKHQV